KCKTLAPRHARAIRAQWHSFCSTIVPQALAALINTTVFERGKRLRLCKVSTIWNGTGRSLRQLLSQVGLRKGVVAN
ncbi:MAG TPA: hypothetical protein VM260_17315, partial [Pirellula sp.]|nr:hypothetical protein [Pirellula sp.]